MTKEYFKNVIIDIIKETSKIPFLNHGGCIHFAYYLSNELSKYGYDHKIFGIFYDKFSTVDDYIRMFNIEGAVHVVLYIKGVGYFDGEKLVKHPKDFYPAEYFSAIQLPKEKIDLNEIRNRKGVWNPSYKKIKYNRRIHNIVKSTFSTKLKYNLFKNG